MPEGSQYVVEWRNPVMGTRRTLRFASREEAEAYIEGRDRKYGDFQGYQRPVARLVEMDQRGAEG